GVIATCPLTMSPDMTPFRPIVSGPQCPDPSPCTRNVPDADSRTDDSASGKSLLSAGLLPAAQPALSAFKYATACPSRSTDPTLWKSVRVGVVVFFAKDTANRLTPTGSGAPMTFSFARLGQVNREGGDMRELLKSDTLIQLYQS